MNMFTMGNIRGLVTAILLGLFVWLIAWAWSRARRPAFDAAARMPLEDEPCDEVIK
jgi:cytochrome c oxidase cbb3-type subunit IV